jgi:hypothetical protein
LERVPGPGIVAGPSKETPVHINRGLVFWGVALITAGGVALAIQAGVIDGAAARQLWRFWPILLIIIGLAIIAARTPFAIVATLVAGLALGGLAGTLVGGFPQGLDVGCGGEPAHTAGDTGTFSGAANVELDLNCGELSVATAPGSDWDVDARYAGDAEPQITADDGSLRVRVDDTQFFGFTDSRQNWSVTLPTDVDLDLSIDANAASSDLALDDARLTGLSIDANAGSVVITVPGASVDGFSLDANAGSVSMTADRGTTLSGSASMNAGSFELCVPDGVDVAITISDENITFSHNLGESGLTRQGDTWRSGTGDAAITLDVSGNAASFSLNPDGGCSGS